MSNYLESLLNRSGDAAPELRPRLRSLNERSFGNFNEEGEVSEEVTLREENLKETTHKKNREKKHDQQKAFTSEQELSNQKLKQRDESVKAASQNKIRKPASDEQETKPKVRTPSNINPLEQVFDALSYSSSRNYRW